MSYQLQPNKVAFAFSDPREPVWNKLGQNLSEHATLDTWKKEAGMDWEALESSLLFQVKNNPIQVYPGKKVIVRSDTGVPLSIVSRDYHVVQPGEVIEFFRDLTEQHGMKLATAGCLFGGTRFWALAEIGKQFEPIQGDPTVGYLLFVTSIDGTLSNTAKFVATRVACQNALTVALNEKNRRLVKKTHHSVWNPTQVKIDLGLLNNSWETFKKNLNRLANHKMNDQEVDSFFKSTFFDPNKEEQSTSEIKRVNNLLVLYKTGAGAEYDYGTALGALNAVTNLYTHGTGRACNPDRRFWSAYFDDEIKINTMNKLLALC